MHFVKNCFIVTLLVILASGSSCSNIKNFKKDRAELNIKKAERKASWQEEKRMKKQQASETEIVEKVGDVNTTVIEPINPADSLYLSYERTACFGRCPIYKINIYNSGYATYEGVNFVERMGEYGTVIADIDLAAIEKKLTDMYFFQLEDKYDNEQLTDLPSKVIEVRKPNVKKKIVARTDVPEKLIGLFDAIDKMIDSVNWEPLN